MKLKNLLSVTFVLIYCNLSSNAQQYYNQSKEYLKSNSVWAFGEYAGLDFNSGGPIPILTGRDTWEAAASVSDPLTGSLLFYVARGGEECWNRNHRRMPNGYNLGGNESTTQTCIVPMIDSPSKYYVFTLSNQAQNGNLKYSVVDMNLNNGLGDIDPNRKAITLFPGPQSEAVTAIPGNNCDVWLMTHRRNNHEFIAFHITKAGIDTNYVSSNPGGPAIPPLSCYCMGKMSVSPNRERIYMPLVFANASNAAGLYKFDPNTGNVYDFLDLSFSPPSMGAYASQFSPDNSKLYLGNGYQFEVSTYRTGAIDSSRTYIGFNKPINNIATGLRLYNDTIYVSWFGTDFISRINKPNLSGQACDFDSAAITLLPGSRVTYSIGFEVVYIPPPDTIKTLVLDSFICADEANIELNVPPGYKNYKWENGSRESLRTVHTTGSYWLSYCDSSECTYKVDTFIFRGMDFPTPVITVNVHELSTTVPYSTYQWYLNGEIISGATNKIYVVTQNGDYTVAVTNGSVCEATSEIYKVTNVNRIGMPGASAKDIHIFPNPSHDKIYINCSSKITIVLSSIEGRKILVNTGRVLSLKNLANGTYLLQIKDEEGHLIKVEKVIKQ